MTAQALAAQVLIDNDYGDLGFFSLGILYAAFGVSSFVSFPIVKFLGARMSHAAGSFCYVVFVSSFIIACKPPSFVSKTVIEAWVLAAACINGFGAAIIWVAQGQYISQCATDRNKGLFNAVFWVFF